VPVYGDGMTCATGSTWRPFPGGGGGALRGRPARSTTWRGKRADEHRDHEAADRRDGKDERSRVRSRRPGHDRRYADRRFEDSGELGVVRRSRSRRAAPRVRWYIDNEPWWRAVQSGEYQSFDAAGTSEGPHTEHVIPAGAAVSSMLVVWIGIPSR